MGGRWYWDGGMEAADSRMMLEEPDSNFVPFLSFIHLKNLNGIFLCLFSCLPFR